MAYNKLWNKFEYTACFCVDLHVVSICDNMALNKIQIRLSKLKICINMQHNFSTKKTKRDIMSNNHFFAYIWLAETHYMAFKL